jgi:hypothetical protein
LLHNIYLSKATALINSSQSHAHDALLCLDDAYGDVVLIVSHVLSTLGRDTVPTG